jgi:RNA polymerase sigma-70 factor, ECF subfamily
MSARISDEVAAALQRVGEGDRTAFLLVVRAYQLTIRSYFTARIYQRADVDDLTQETFLTAYQKLSEFPRGGDFEAWLRGIAYHKVLHYRRQAHRRGRAMDGFREAVVRKVEDELAAAAGDDRTEKLERLLTCIARLPDRLRRVVRAGLDGAKPAQLAADAGTTVEIVYNLNYRANRILRKCMQGAGS